MPDILTWRPPINLAGCTPCLPRIAYLAHGRLFVRGGDGSVERLESTFADKYKDRLLKIKRQHEWKDAGRGAMFAGRTWGMNPGADPEHIHPEFTLVAPAAGADSLLYFHGKIIDAERARIEAAKKGGDDAPSIVPRSWELIRMEERGEGRYGEDEVLARGVIAFALGESGDLVYSNGSALFRLCASARKPEIIERRKDVQEVVIL